MADYILAHTGVETDSSIQKSLDNYVNVKSFGAVGDFVADDTAAIQAAINSLPVFTHGAELNTASTGGGIIHFPQGKYNITSTLVFPAAVTFEGESEGTILSFNPTSADTMFEGDPTRPSRNTGWDYVTFRNLMMVSKLLNSPYIQNTCIDFTEVQRWKIENCYLEGWDTCIQGGAVTYYHRIDQTEFFNNRLVLHTSAEGAAGACQPVVITGGVMWSYEDDWTDIIGALGIAPDEFIISEASLAIFGTAIESRNAVRDPETYVCIRCTGGGGVTLSGAYSESSYPLVELDMDSHYKHSHVDMNHNFAKTIFKLLNFTKTAVDTPNYANDVASSFSCTNANGEYVDLVLNANMNKGLYGFHYAGSVTSFDETNTFLNKSGVAKVTYNATGDGQSHFKYLIPLEKLENYYGQRLYFGALIRTTNCYESIGDTYDITKSDFRVQDSVVSTGYKSAPHAIIDYGDGWKLYFTSYDIWDGMDALWLYPRVTPLATDGSSTMECAGMFAWKGNPVVVPAYSDKDIGDIYASAAPTGTLSDGPNIHNNPDDNGLWEVGDKIYNDLTSTADFEGWICTVAGSPGTWKGFGAIEA